MKLEKLSRWRSHTRSQQLLLRPIYYIGMGGADLYSSFFLPSLVGWGKAAEMCMTGSRVTAEEAYRIGLPNQVVSREELLNTAKGFAAGMCTKYRFGLRLARDAFNAARNSSSLEEANRMEEPQPGPHHRQRLNVGREGAEGRQGGSTGPVGD